MSAGHNVGFRVFTQIRRPPQALIEALGKLETTCLSDAMHRFGGMDARIRPAHPAMRMAGPAVTVRVPPGDNLMVYKALDVAHPGDVIAVEVRGDTSVALWGERLSRLAAALKLAGVVIDGCVRDLPGICDAAVPVFARPFPVPNAALKDGPGEVNVPVSIGNVPVLPGDVVVGDRHGVIVIPRQDAQAVLENATCIADTEAGSVAVTGAPDWVDAALVQLACEIVNGEWKS